MIVKILTILSAILINCSCEYYFELYFMAAFSNILLLHSYDLLLHSSWFVVAFSMIYWCINLYYLLLPSLLFIYAFQDNYSSIPHYLYKSVDSWIHFTFQSKQLSVVEDILNSILLLHFLLFIAAFPRLIVAFLMIYCCILYDLLVHSSLLFMLHSLLFIAALPMIYCCIHYFYCYNLYYLLLHL